MFTGIQNYNINGEGLLRSIKRLFISKPIAIDTAKRAASTSSGNKTSDDSTDGNDLQLKDTYKSDKAVPWMSLNSDKTIDASVNYNDIEWTQSPASGVSRKMIEVMYLFIYLFNNLIIHYFVCFILF